MPRILVKPPEGDGEGSGKCAMKKIVEVKAKTGEVNKGFF